MNRKIARQRRALRTRLKLRELRVPRLSIYISAQHIYAQLISAQGDNVIASASTLEKDWRGQVRANIEGARKIGARIAERARKKNISEMGFDRSGFKYHGRVKALADAAREAGLRF